MDKRHQERAAFSMKYIRFSKHAREQASERGATNEEVEEAIRKGSREHAARGREMCRYSFSFNRRWQGKRYRIKQVAPVIKEEADESLSSPSIHFIFEGCRR